jgi:hypothetical protein
VVDRGGEGAAGEEGAAVLSAYRIAPGTRERHRSIRVVLAKAGTHDHRGYVG